MGTGYPSVGGWRWLAGALVAVSVLVGLEARGQELRWTHFGVRPLGMGNAYVAVADDYNALFYNPAGLARLKSWDGDLFNPTLEASSRLVTGVQEIIDFASSGENSTSQVLDFIESHLGENYHGAMQLTPHLIFRNFGFGIGLQMDLDLIAHKDIAVGVKAGPTLIAPFSFAANFFENRLSVGGSLKLVARGGIDRDFDIQTIESFQGAEGGTSPELSDFVIGGFAPGVDFGMLFTPTQTLEPTLGLSVTDIGGTSFTPLDFGGTSTGAPPIRLPAVNTGISMVPWRYNNMFARGSVDMHVINQPASFSKKLNFGAEWGYKTLVSVQMGLHQGYATAGLQFDVGLLKLALATYAVELGPHAASGEENYDRRYVGQVKILL